MIALLLATSALALTLDEVRALASDRAIEVEGARAQASVARAARGEAVGDLLPSVVGFADFSIGAGQTPFGFPRPIRDQAGFGVRATWRAIDPSGWAAASAARRTARGQEALYEWTMLVSRTEATAAYAAVLAEQDVVAAYAQAFDDATRQEVAAASLVDAGIRPPADRAQARAETANARALLVTADGEATALCAELQGLLRIEVTGACDLEPVQWVAPPPSAVVHPALRAAREALGAAAASQTAAGLTFAPNVAVNATAGEYLVEGSSAGFGWSATLGLEVPVFLGGTRFAGLSAARAERDRAEAALDQQERDLSVLRVASEVRLRAAEARVEALVEAYASAEEALRLVEERYNAGLEGITEWLTARRTRDAAAVLLARGRADVGRAIAEVEAARGG